MSSSPREQHNSPEDNVSARPTSSSTAEDDGENTDKATAELSAVVDELLNQLSTKFSTISSELLSKMDDMSKRLDNLESSIQAGKNAEK